MQPIRDYRAFVDSLHRLQARHYLGHPHSRIANEDAFAEMHRHLVDYHSGVAPVHSFLDANGAVFDCIPIEAQVSLRGRTVRAAKPPHLPKHAAGSEHGAHAHLGHPAIQLHPDRRDALGNRMVAPAGTIPVRRHSFEELSGYRTLRDYMAKRSPLKKGLKGMKALAARQAKPVTDQPTHWYANGYQSADNIGGGTTLNVWDPAIGAGQNMSLSQLWLTSGDHHQTVEAGWQVNPRRYGNSRPVLFTYWTADGYATTGGYNLSCPGFVQTNGRWALGGALPAWSAAGGQQAEIAVFFFLEGDKWWLYVNGDGPDDAVGYFPAAMYKGGPLGKGAAQLVCGGEVAGTASAPPMGSGAFADAGWRHAAYQRNVHYFPPKGGAPRPAELDLTVPTKGLFTAKAAKSDAPWGAALWFGGPGGRGR